MLRCLACLARRLHADPCPVARCLPCLSIPSPDSPGRAMPFRSPPRRACLAMACPAAPRLPCHGTSRLSRPCLPCPSRPGRTRPRLAPPAVSRGFAPLHSLPCPFVRCLRCLDAPNLGLRFLPCHSWPRLTASWLACHASSGEALPWRSEPRVTVPAVSSLASSCPAESCVVIPMYVLTKKFNN